MHKNNWEHRCLVQNCLRFAFFRSDEVIKNWTIIDLFIYEQQISLTEFIVTVDIDVYPDPSWL